MPIDGLLAAPRGSIPGTGGRRLSTSILGNPYAMRDVFDKLDHALDEVITAIEHEEQSAGTSGSDMTALQKLRGWQMELAGIREGGAKPSRGQASGMPQEGGLFTD